MASVPHDLIAAIIDELHHDRASLKACSLAAASLRSPSQHHLFHSIWLHQDSLQFRMGLLPTALHERTGTPSGAIERVSALLADSPYLASYVRDLTIDRPDSVEEDMALQRVLKAVPNLERFVISGLRVRWDTLSLPLRSTILDVIARPTLDRLHLLRMRNVPVPVILRALSSVSVLSIHDTSFEEAYPENPGPPTLPHLEHFILNTRLPSTYELILPHALTLANVKRLFLLVDPTCRLHAERLLSSIGDGLECLELDYESLSSSFPWDLPHLPNLHSLTLIMFRGTFRGLPNGLAGTLAALPRTSLTLQFTIQALLEERKWPEDGPLLGLEDWKRVPIHCQLFFIATEWTQPASRDVAFGAFCAAMWAAFPGFSLEFSREGEKKPCVMRELL
ncbi:hypothetical protein C8R44DRAFT_974161 [Mycena epipterygia]|nr:hypothetical protein C8R44DRAFT_974161 [Mycena epipterygia]